MAIAVLLAWLTYRFVETRYRRSDAGFPKIVNRTFVTPTLAVSAAALGLHATNGLGLYAFGNYKDQYRILSASAYVQNRAAYICQRPLLRGQDFQDPRCDINSNGDVPRILLWGDSNAAHYVGMLAAFAEQHNFSFKNLAHSGCPPFQIDAGRFVSETLRQNCSQSANLVASNVGQFETVILSASWPRHLKSSEPARREALEETVDWLNSLEKSVVLIGKAPIIEGADPECGIKAIKVPFLNCARNATVRSTKFQEVNRFLAGVAEARADVTYFDITDYYCEDVICSAYLDGVYTYRDPGHLNTNGSWHLGATILARQGLPPAFAGLPQSSPVQARAVGTLRQDLNKAGAARFDALQGGVNLLDGTEAPDHWSIKWSGLRYGVSEDGRFLLTDDQPDRSRILRTTFQPNVLFEELNADDVLTVIVEIRVDRQHSTSNTITAIVRDSVDHDNRLDLMAFPSDELTWLKQLANGFNSNVVFQSDEITMYLAFENISADTEVEIRIPAASSNGTRAYSPEGIGTTALTSVTAYIEK